jgi:hypothetical protein
MKRTLKLIHELGTVGVMGAVAAQIVLASLSRDLPIAELAIARDAIWGLTRYLLLPSLALVLVSGLIAMGVTKAFHDADWVIVKALMTPLVFEATILMVDRPARAAAEITEDMAGGDTRPELAADLQTALGQERWGLWVVLAVYTINVVLSIWRPRRRRKPTVSAPAEKPGDEAPDEAEPRAA